MVNLGGLLRALAILSHLHLFAKWIDALGGDEFLSGHVPYYLWSVAALASRSSPSASFTSSILPSQDDFARC
ncbi:hypothetical protein [Porphyromonas endodontalis]|uniref:hypothetical protein n=1 Tax=Porphyromonas endodontalis TaxID=28124 RepID=UPI003C7A33EB